MHTAPLSAAACSAPFSRYANIQWRKWPCRARRVGNIGGPNADFVEIIRSPRSLELKHRAGKLNTEILRRYCSAQGR